MFLAAHYCPRLVHHAVPGAGEGECGLAAQGRQPGRVRMRVSLNAVVRAPEGDEDPGVAEHDHQVREARHEGAVEVGEAQAAIVVDDRAGPCSLV